MVVVAAEMIAVNSGLGYLIIDARNGKTDLSDQDVEQLFKASK